MSEGEKIIPINIEEEMKSAYIDYSMSVIVSRALPDVEMDLNQFTEESFMVCMNWVSVLLVLIKRQQELSVRF